MNLVELNNWNSPSRLAGNWKSRTRLKHSCWGHLWMSCKNTPHRMTHVLWRGSPARVAVWAAMFTTSRGIQHRRAEMWPIWFRSWAVGCQWMSWKAGLQQECCTLGHGRWRKWFGHHRVAAGRVASGPGTFGAGDCWEDWDPRRFPVFDGCRRRIPPTIQAESISGTRPRKLCPGLHAGSPLTKRPGMALAGSGAQHRSQLWATGRCHRPGTVLARSGSCHRKDCHNRGRAIHHLAGGVQSLSRRHLSKWWWHRNSQPREPHWQQAWAGHIYLKSGQWIGKSIPWLLDWVPFITSKTNPIIAVLFVQKWQTGLPSVWGAQRLWPTSCSMQVASRDWRSNGGAVPGDWKIVCQFETVWGSAQQIWVTRSELAERGGKAPGRQTELLRGGRAKREQTATPSVGVGPLHVRASAENWSYAGSACRAGADGKIASQRACTAGALQRGGRGTWTGAGTSESAAGSGEKHLGTRQRIASKKPSRMHSWSQSCQNSSRGLW